MTGPAIGGLLAQPSRGALGFQLPLLVAAGFGLASALAVIFFVRETSPRPTHGAPARPGAPACARPSPTRSSAACW